MVKVARIIGGIVALAGGALTLIAAFLLIPYLLAGRADYITLTVTLCLAILAIVGGILLILDKTFGGILSIIAGAMLIVGSFIVIGIGPFANEIPLAVYLTQLNIMLNIGYYIDPLLAIAGGIVGLVVGSE